MASVVRMPGISADADSAILVEWAITPGQEIRRGDVVATVETDKAVVDIVAEDDGVLLRLISEAGETVAIGGPMAVLLSAGEQASDEPRILAELGLGEPGPGASESAVAPLAAEDEDRSQDDLALDSPPPIEQTADQLVGQGAPAHNGSGGRMFATPLVRRLAAEAGVDLGALTGTGPHGRIRRRDLEAFRSSLASTAPPAATPPAATAPDAVPPSPAAPVPSPLPASVAPTPAGAVASAPVAVEGSSWTDEPATKFRRAVANGLTASKQTVPHFYLKATCQVDALLELRARVNASGAVKVTINDFVVKAAAVALQRVPEMNVSWTGDAVRHFRAVDIGVAMASERGLVVPVLRSVGSLTLSAVSAAVKDLAGRAASNTLQQREMEGGSLTISNLGMYGVEEFTAIINPPQAAILAVGAVVPRAVEGSDGQLALARGMTVVLSVDHRPVDGALAARWLQTFKQLIENPLDIVV